MTHFFMELLCSFEWSCDHLTEDWLFFLQVCQLLLEIVILLLLVYHSQFETTVEWLDQWGCCLHYFLVDVLNFSLHGVELLSVQLDQFVVLLEILVCLPGEILDRVRGTSQSERWPVAWVEFWSFSGEVLLRWLISDSIK